MGRLCGAGPAEARLADAPARLAVGGGKHGGRDRRAHRDALRPRTHGSWRAAGERPDFEAAGVEIAADIAPWEEAKLRLLNGAHSGIAYLGGLAITRAVANHRAESVSKAIPPRAAAEEPGEPGDAKAGDPAAEAPPATPLPIAPASPGASMRRPAMPNQFSTWDFISLAVAALVAYELGRGTGVAPSDAMVGGPSEPALGGSHPDA